MTDLSYRDLCPDDFPAMHDLVSRWDVVRMLGSWPWPPDPAFTRNRCAPYGGDGFVWGIFRGARFVGTVAITGGELGYMIHPDAQGQGIVTRAVQTALRTGFDDHDLPEVTADIWADNLVSRHILTRAGFELIREERVHALARDTTTASETYALTQDRWRLLSARA